MSATEKATPIAAVLAALATLSCCLPLGFVGAAGLAGASIWAGPLRWWLVGGALALLALGFAQLYGRRACRRSRSSVAVFWIATVLVLALVLFPQLVASWLAR
ncbi:MAG: hypothetical protein ACRD2H_12315 [Terriglobales bacterium]